MAASPENDVGETIPPLTAHAVSVSLPTWDSNVGYEEGRPDVVGRMKTGYPRFFVHKSIQRFAEAIAATYGHADDTAMLFPSPVIANRCLDWFRKQAPELFPSRVHAVDLVPNPEHKHSADHVLPKVSAVIFPKDQFKIAKAFWQHSGDGVSSRRAEYCHKAFEDGVLVEKSQAGQRRVKGPKRYQKRGSVDVKAPGANGQHTAPEREPDGQDPLRFVEERFGRNLDVGFADNAKLAIRRRIAGSLTANVGLEEALKLEADQERTRQVAGFSQDDVYLFPSGMSAIFNTHRCLMATLGQEKSVSYGFPYIDTLKILEKFGPGAVFYGFGSNEELDEFEKRLESGEKFLALFCEFPGNPLLKSPDLQRIRALADKYDFCVVVDETIGNFLNVHVLPYADVVVSSLTKIFSGDSNVMGGSAVLNPKGRHYEQLKKTLASEYEDNLWPEDAIFLERNSRDFVSRIDRINVNAEAICDVLMKHPKIKAVNYPKYSPTRANYDQCKRPHGGYGGLLSATFYSTDDAVKFFDNLDTAKGPSLGTNFTLSSPYVLLAHFTELEWAASYGVESNLVRFSVGLEDTEQLVATFNHALAAMGPVETQAGAQA
ncbi:pyridoxal phosphate-dependent transferase [Phyllosticta capitalensis]|uniref:Pyridoxal phosphate-dependent transferase n=1 Tax=Phyllosticta capitalensis TaxID=121624 RepID=A0ABR1YDA9_9PEZI